MEKLHGLITAPLHEVEVERIAAVNSMVEVTYAMEEVRAELDITPESAIPLGRPMWQRELTRADASKALDSMLAHTEVMLSWRLPLNLLSRAPRLRWIQRFGAGVEMLSGAGGILDSDVIVTNASGIHATMVGEFVLCLMLMIAKKAPHFLGNQRTRFWEPFITSELDGKTVGIVGLGRIGREVARLARAFRMRVLAVRRSAPVREKGEVGVDELFPSAQLLQMISNCDFVVLTVPLTLETRGLIGEAELKSMKPAAYLINVARGPVINQDVLLKALKEGWIAGAALDVFETEPLPLESELWDLPNVIISPHSAGYREGHTRMVTDLFCENLRRFLAGKPLLNLIDKTKGY